MSTHRQFDKILDKIEDACSDIERACEDLKENAGAVITSGKAGIAEALKTGLPNVQARFGHSSEEARAVERMLEKLSA